MNKKIENIGFVSLGCSKNLVDTEMMIGIFKNRNYNIVNDPKEADVIIVNTCGFIGPAKEEAINTLLEMAEYKKKGRCKYIIGTGCLVQRYKDELSKEMPEIDGFIKFSDYDEFEEQVLDIIDPKNKRKDYEKLDFNNRVISTGKNYAYLRIADGCDNFCTFCAIPYIRGRYKSRKMEDILDEAKKLSKSGIKELIVIAQDTGRYGSDIYGKNCLAELLNKLSKIPGICWIRFLYTYPETIDDNLINEVKQNDKICKYFDIPMQHVSDKILKEMNRKSTKKSEEELIKKLRKEIPNVIIRSTLMVGFPGETAEDFDELYNFVEKSKFDKLGCFMYSKEEGTAAAKMKNTVHPMTKKSRYNKIMKLQSKVSEENLNKFIGKKYKCLVEDFYINEKDEKFAVRKNIYGLP